MNTFTKVSNLFVKITIKPIRNVSSFKLANYSSANAWKVHSYGDLSELQMSSIRLPQVDNPRSLLIKVEAASINPIDLLMLGGYGRTLFQVPRYYEMELPLTLGRDFSGTIIYKGVEIDDSYEIGDSVYGFIPLHKQGSFSEIVVADVDHICKKPKNLSHVESASLVYAGMTAWCSLFIMGNLLNKPKKGTKILILGGSGGVGTIAIQLLKHHLCEVFATCATDAKPLVESLGAISFDYKEENYLKKLAEIGRFHIILDCAKFGVHNLPPEIKYEDFITLNSPLVKNTDQYGLIGGLMASATDILKENLKSLDFQKCVKWGFFLPSTYGFECLDKLIQKGEIKPVIHKEFKFKELPYAFEEVEKGHLRGKVVINFN